MQRKHLRLGESGGGGSSDQCCLPVRPVLLNIPPGSQEIPGHREDPGSQDAPDRGRPRTDHQPGGDVDIWP